MKGDTVSSERTKAWEHGTESRSRPGLDRYMVTYEFLGNLRVLNLGGLVEGHAADELGDVAGRGAERS